MCTYVELAACYTLCLRKHPRCFSCSSSADNILNVVICEQLATVTTTNARYEHDLLVEILRSSWDRHTSEDRSTRRIRSCDCTSGTCKDLLSLNTHTRTHIQQWCNFKFSLPSLQKNLPPPRDILLSLCCFTAFK